MRRALAMLGLSAMLMLVWLALAPTTAVATIDGPCTASIDGVDVTEGHDTPDTAVPLQSGDRIPIAGTASGQVTDLTYALEVPGGEIQVGNVTVSGNSWEGFVDLEQISNITVGLFEVTAEVQASGGDCSGVAYVCIEGRSPVTTAAGAGATAFGIGGIILLGLSLTRAGRMGGARAGIQGFAGGATAGVGGAVLLQQFCVLPLTAASAAAVPVAIGAAGAIGASVLRRASTRGAREISQRMRAGRGVEVPGQPGQPAPGQPTTPEMTQQLDRARDLAGQGAGSGGGGGGGGPQASTGGGPSGGGPSGGGAGGGGAGGGGAGGGGAGGGGAGGGGAGGGGAGGGGAGGGGAGGGGAAGPSGGPSPTGPSSAAGGGPSPAGPSGAGGGGPAPAGPSGAGGGGPAPTGPSGGGGGGPAPTGPTGGGGGGPAPTGPTGGGGGGPAPTGPTGTEGGGPAPTGPTGGGGGPAPTGPTGIPEPPPPPPPADGGAVIPPLVPPAKDEDVECGSCGTRNTPDSQFCTNCGTRLST